MGLLKYCILCTFLFSCGYRPLFSSIKDTVPSEVSTNLALGESKVQRWPGNERLDFAISWNAKPILGEKSSFTIKFWDRYQNDLFGPYQIIEEKLCVFIWMKMHDGNEHGSSPTVLHEREDHYFIDEIYFIMKGQWDLHIRSVENEEHCTSLKSSPYISEQIININVI